ncbi:helix-turn-helix transcriptional regulator [Pseudomonas sp. TH41]|uniref:helix-turn-helix domain-containing protein n=1 Tax=Pseudomonas sp. TH41 TaxID=2796405 RepID=UPI0019143FF0|nr:helix-turn-helix transcriptional regulator [Pseudomonas sp. TH41]
MTSPWISQITSDEFTVTRAYQKNPNVDRVVDIPCLDKFSIIVQLEDFADHRLWRGGRLAYSGGHRKASVSLPFMGDGLRCQHRAAYDNVRFNIPRATFDDLQQENGMKRFERFVYDQNDQDEILYHLARALLPTLIQSSARNQLFLDHILLATCDHVYRRYVRGASNSVYGKCKLTTRQVLLAKDIIATHLAGDLSVQTIAAECDLSRSHFSRAFKQTTGMAPHAWLMQMRFEKAKELMMSQPLKPISSIAQECGFSDQSHLTRVFTRMLGTSPAAWRRQRRASTSLLGEEPPTK